MRESDDAVNRVENEDGDHGKVKHPFAPESVGPNETQYKQSNRDLARCESKDNPWLSDPVNPDNLGLLFLSEIEQMSKATDGCIVG